MASTEPFIPNDKPRSWIVFVCAGLIGLASGLIAFVAAWLELPALKSLAFTAFLLSWAVVAVFGLVFLVRLISGRYGNVEPRPWKKQVW